MVDAHEVVEQPGQASGESVEAGQGVLADGDEHARGSVRADEHGGELLDERPVGPVIEEVLLELIEDDQERTLEPLRRRADRLGKRRDGKLRRKLRRQLLKRRPDRLLKPDDRIARPRAKRDRRVLRGLAPLDPATARVAYVADNACSQQRALAHAARPVEHRQAVREQVVEDDVARAIASEEPRGIVFAIRGQALIGAAAGTRPGGGRGAQERAFMASIQSSSRASTISTRWRVQNALSIGSGARSMAHEPKRRTCCAQMWCRITRRFQSRMA